MSDKLPNLSYYDSSGQEYGFTKPYSDNTAQVIDNEVQELIRQQYERAKQILRDQTAGHGQLTKILVEREVIFTDDLINIFGKRPWATRSDLLLADEEKKKAKASTDAPDTTKKDEQPAPNAAPVETPVAATEQEASEEK